VPGKLDGCQPRRSDPPELRLTRQKGCVGIGAYVGSDRQWLTPFGMISTVVGAYETRQMIRI
jgi:hypothetical protein